MNSALPDWRASEIACIASGPSLTIEDCAAVKVWRDAAPGRAVIVVNSSWRAAPWADLLYACDFAWWDVHGAEVRKEFEGAGITACKKAAALHGLHRVDGEHGPGLCTKPGTVYFGGNSGYQAIGLAFHLGARRIVLLGYDMQRTGGRSHWHGDHPEPLGNGNSFPLWLQRYGALAGALKTRRIDCVNASRETALRCFERATITEALR